MVVNLTGDCWCLHCTTIDFVFDVVLTVVAGACTALLLFDCCKFNGCDVAGACTALFMCC